MDMMQNRTHPQMPHLRQAAGSETTTTTTQPSVRSMAAAAPPSPSPSPVRQLLSEESWVDIVSTQSSSSLSSANDEIITTGLRVRHDSNLHRRRRARSTGQFIIGTGYRAASGGGGGSSQDEYEESESESDRVMTSSNEGIGPSPLQRELRRSTPAIFSVSSSDTLSEREGDDEEEDDDENATAVNYPRSSRRAFEPRPNVFSHPPTTAQQLRAQAGASYPSRRPGPRPSSQRNSYPQHSPYNVVSPQYQAEHDEALRTSLSTLLSAAAAVRGLKPGQARPETPVSNRVDPVSLRLVSESVALGDTTTEYASTSTSPSRATSASTRDMHKRKASPQPSARLRSSSRERQAAKRARVEDISPTLLTWVVSAGVVVLVSALTFSVGYVVGKEAGHAEAMGHLASVGTEGGRCSKEAASGLGRASMGLRRIRFGGSGVRV